MLDGTPTYRSVSIKLSSVNPFAEVAIESNSLHEKVLKEHYDSPQDERQKQIDVDRVPVTVKSSGEKTNRGKTINNYIKNKS